MYNIISKFKGFCVDFVCWGIYANGFVESFEPDDFEELHYIR